MRLHSIPKIRICVKSGLNMLQFRELTADTMNKLIRIPGIVISAPSLYFPTIEPLSLKLREAPDMVPVGELPRHIILSADRYNAAQVVPGSRVIATGIYYIFNSSNNKSAGVSALRTPYLRVVHLELSSPSASGAGGLNPFGVQFTPEEEKEFNEMARSE
ncbi:hypothetical protein BJV77DRAFT_1076826 [Russula vinacea]|nr:hypothetical protein BJV77DRAFT_1076826 [Russula vinacea]